MKKRILSIILTLVMVSGLLPTVALAASDPNANRFDISEGNITIKNGTTNGTVKVTYGSSQSKDNISPTTMLTLTGKTTSNMVIVNTTSDRTVKITLDSVDVQLANASAFDIQGASVVEMTLVGSNILKSGSPYAGLQVENGYLGIAAVTIGGDGSLEATGGGHAAGIGGRGEWYGANGANGGKITIISGTIKATGWQNGSGIGGGGPFSAYLNPGAGGEVTITGGTVIATGGSWRGAGIGGGGSRNGGAGGTIKITGGNVTATGGGNAAGIGGGGNDTGYAVGAAGDIKISNTAKVIAVSWGTKPPIDDNDGNITPDSGTVANVLVANYQANVTGNPNTEVKDPSGNVLSPVVSFAPQGGYKSIAFTVPMASYTLYTGDAKQMGTKSGTTSTTFTVAAGLNVFADVTASTYTAKVTVNKDGGAFTEDTPTIKMSTSSSALTGAVGGTLLNGEYTFNGLADGKTYYAWEDGATDTCTGQSVTIASNSATVNYYTLSLANGAGTSSHTGGGYYLAGKSVPIDTTVNLGYTWSKWTSSNTGVLSDQSAKSPSIVMPAGAVTLTATSTLTPYTINFQLNGGNASPANPTSYTVESAAITLNNPTRTGYSFVGWSGTGLTGNTNQMVIIPTGSTGNTTYTANWKADAPTSAPPDSIVTAKTDTNFTIATQAGCEYSVDGSIWHSGTGSYTFIGLTANKSYNLVCRVAAVSTGDTSAASDASSALSVTTKNAAPAAPSISFGSITANSVTITAITGAEYTKDNGVTWQDSNVFVGLSAATQYTFAIRKKETADTVAGIKASVAHYTPAATPAADEGYSINYETEKITVNSGYEVSTDASFGTVIASNATLTPDTTYYIRVAASGSVPASAYVSFSIAARPSKPTGITAVKTKNSITITPVAGQEYKIGTGSWQDSGSFTGLSQNTDYTVSARVKAVSNLSISFASEVYSTTIKTKSDVSLGFSLPTISVSPTYAPGKTLNDIILPLGWDWSTPATVPTVTNTGYSAVYTPPNADMVDYSGIPGYAVDGSGKVTITKIIPLTVSRATPTAADFTYTAPATLDYNATAKFASVTANGGISGMGTVTVKYYDKDGGVVGAPTNAGTYTVKIDVAQGNNYATANDITDSTWTFTIAKVAQDSLSITKKPTSATYGDTFTLATEGGSGTSAVTWAVTSGSSATVDESSGVVTITGVGETAITATRAADSNYTGAVMDTYTFTPEKRLITVAGPSATVGWTKTYDGKTDFDKSVITVGGITNKVGLDVVGVSVQGAAYDTTTIGSGDKTLTITYVIDGTNSGFYLAPNNTVINTASITAAMPTIILENKTETYTDKIIKIDAATVKGVTGGTTPDGTITYTYYTKDTCTDADKTSIDKSGSEAIGGAPKNAGTYYVKATIASSGNYTAGTSATVTLAIYYPSSGEDKSSAPVIVDGKTIDMGTSEVKDGTTTVTVDQNKMSEQLQNAKDSVVIPVTSKTDTAAAQLVVQNIENMAKKGMTLTVQADGINYNLPAAAVDTAALLKGLEANDSSKVTFTVTMTELSKTAVTIKDGMLILPPMEFTVTATYSGKSIAVENFETYVQRDIELPGSVDPKTITTAVVVEANGTERHVPTEVYSKGGKWYAKINSMTNSTYALIQRSASFSDCTGKWYDAVVTEMASRKIISGIGENMFAGDLSITRAEFAAIIVRALGLPADGTSTFSDVSASAWYSGAVATAVQHGLVTGEGDNRFVPDAYITRQKAMTMLQRAAKLTYYSGTAGNLEGFSDASSVDTWAQGAAKWNVGSGLIVGSDGLLRPNDNISRAESATVILRLLQKTGLVDVRSEA